LTEKEDNGRIYRLRGDGHWYIVNGDGTEQRWMSASFCEVKLAKEVKQLQSALDACLNRLG